jgi:hypothetical protein
MKKTTLIMLLCFLFIGLNPLEEEWTIVRSDGIEYSGVSLLRLEGDSLVATAYGDTLFIPIADISEMTTSSHPLGIPAHVVGCVAGAAVGMACVEIEVPKPKDRMERGFRNLATIGCAAVGASAGALAGCLVFPEKQTRYSLGDNPLPVKRSMIASILSRHTLQHD